MTCKCMEAIALLTLLLACSSNNSSGQGLEVPYVKPGPVLVQIGIDTSDTGHLKSLVDTADSRTSQYAALYLAERGVIDAAPIVKARYARGISKLPPETDFVVALYLFRDPEAPRFISDFIDTALVWTGRGERGLVADLLEGMVMLLNLGDYSRWPLVDSLFQHPEVIPAPGYLSILSAFAKQSDLRQRAYGRLTSFVTDPRYGFRLQVLIEFKNFLDIPETQSVLRSIARTDTALVVVDYAIKTLFVRYNDPDVISICKEVILARQDTTMFDILLSWLWNVIRTPDALAALWEIKAGLPEGDLRAKASRKIRFFQPKRPPAETPVDELLETLVSYKHEVAEHHWLGDKTLITELDNHLENAHKHFEKGDQKNAAKQVEKFQEKVDFWHKKTEEDEKSAKPRGKRFITIEGWKFLHYHAEYILDRLPGK